MSYFSANQVSAFTREIPRINARFAFDRPMGVVRRANIQDDPEIYGGLIARTQGFARLAVDEVNRTIVLLTAKVADDLRGVRDPETGHVRPTKEGLQRSYVIAAKRHQAGGPALPPDRAEFFDGRIQAYCDEMRAHSAGTFTLYGVQTENQILFTNNRVSYSITGDGDKHRVRFCAPLLPHSRDLFVQKPVGAITNTKIQKLLARRISIEQADEMLMAHWQQVSSKLWDHKDIYEGEGSRVALNRFFTQLARYPREHALGMMAATLVAGGFMTAKHTAAASVVAGLSLAHAVSDVTLKEVFSRGLGWSARRRELKRASSIHNYDFDEDVVGFYLDRSTGNPEKLCTHIDLEKCRPEDFRFLTVEEVQGMLQDHAQFEENLLPSSLKGLALYGDQRGFTSTVLYPDPRTKINMHQTGLVTLKNVRADGKIDIFAAYCPERVVNEKQRLPQSYIDQIHAGGTNIQHIVYNRRALAFSDGFEQEAVTYAQMKEMLGVTLFQRPESSPSNFVPPVGQHFQAASWKCIEQFFAPHPEESARAIIVPSIHALI